MPKVELVERRRREILSATARVMAERGYQETNIADVAGELGIGHGTFYRYFDNKRHIAEAVVDFIVEQVGQLVSDIDPSAADTLEEYASQINLIGQRLFDFFIQHRDLAAVFFFESYGVDRAMTQRIQQVIEIFGAYVEEYLKNGRDKGFLRSDLDVEITARAVNGMIFAGALRTFAQPDPEMQRDRWIAAIRALMLHGMAT